MGYGDYKAFNDEDPVWATEMLYLLLVTMAGTLLFTTVTNQIFTYERLHTVDEIVNKTLTSMEEYLYEISKQRPEKFLGTDYIEICLNNMEAFIRSSTRCSFTENHFF